MKPNIEWRRDPVYKGWTDLLRTNDPQPRMLVTYRRGFNDKIWKVMFSDAMGEEDAKYSVREYNEGELQVMLYQKCLLLGLLKLPDKKERR